jgi:hypothetical protein
MEEEIERIRSENKSLRSQNEELRAQMLHDSVASGQLLLADGPSLAAELNGMDSDEVHMSKRDHAEVTVVLFFLRFFVVAFGFSIFSRSFWELFA